MQKALVIIAKEGFQDHEYAGTVAGLMDTEFDIVVASTQAGICTGKFGDEVEAHLSLMDVNVDDFDRIAFIGGPGAVELQGNQHAHRIAKEAVEKGKILGAICIAPTILANAGVLQGKKATVWNGDGAQQALLEDAGATYTGELVTVDGKLITGNGPEAAQEFGRVFAQA